MSGDLKKLKKAYRKLEDEIEEKKENLENLKAQRGEIGRKIDRIEKKNSNEGED